LVVSPITLCFGVLGYGNNLFSPMLGYCRACALSAPCGLNEGADALLLLPLLLVPQRCLLDGSFLLRFEILPALPKGN
jgi:hypothetical protein